MSGGEDVAALVAFDVGLHVCIPLVKSQSLQKKRPESGLRPFSGRGLNAQARRVPGLICVYSSILRNGAKLMGTFLCACKCYLLGGLEYFPPD